VLPFLSLLPDRLLPQGDRDADQQSRMYTAVAGKLQSALGSFQPATCCTWATAAAAGGSKQQLKAAHMAAGLELCRLSKLLLVAGEVDTA
jgi:hypothetical protein